MVGDDNNVELAVGAHHVYEHTNCGNRLLLRLSGTLLLAQDCLLLKSTSVEEASEYLKHAGTDAIAAGCVQSAFRNIAAAPPDKSIPLLIGLLGYKRPMTDGERLGIFMHGSEPSVFYPAVREISTLKSVAEPTLIKLLYRGRTPSDTEFKNAIYSLLLIDEGNTVEVLEKLRREKLTVTGVDAKIRLQGAVEEALKWCDERGKGKEQCAATLN